MGKIASQNNELKMDSAAERLSRIQAVLGSTPARRKGGKSEKDVNTREQRDKE